MTSDVYTCFYLHICRQTLDYKTLYYNMPQLPHILLYIFILYVNKFF